MESLYCKCFCNFVNSKGYTSLVVCTDEQVLIIEKSNVFEAKNQYEAFIKIANRMMIKLEEKYSKYLLNREIIFIINNIEVYRDLASENKREDLSSSVNGLYQYLYNFIRKYNVVLVQNINEYGLISKDSNSIISDYFKLYELINTLYFSIIKSHSINGNFNKKLSQYDMATQDILHFIEFGDLNTEKKVEFIDTIRKIRIERRKLKNEIELLTYFSCQFTYILNIVDSLFIKSSQRLSEDEFIKYKKMFSTKVAREEFLKAL